MCSSDLRKAMERANEESDRNQNFNSVFPSRKNVAAMNSEEMKVRQAVAELKSEFFEKSADKDKNPPEKKKGESELPANNHKAAAALAPESKGLDEKKGQELSEFKAQPDKKQAEIVEAAKAALAALKEKYGDPTELDSVAREDSAQRNETQAGSPDRKSTRLNSSH